MSPSSSRKLTRGSRRRLTAFCDLALVSSQISPSITAYHIAVKCGWPSGPMVASVPVRLELTKSAISASDMTMSARCLVPMASVCQQGSAGSASSPPQ
ncbi:Uncharacterised protein [Mycobacterium tuberculosis]|uniref:Uncharacterized protein n=1 Tax=Mycobacterium tuberculosis TaxID=1773 RepID=A0A0U0SL45_MYCTX|nr:Uncharacterised protein [Mycobacterium tuberculosis]